MKRAGARFSQHGGQAVMTFRVALLSERFEAFHELLRADYTAAVNSPRDMPVLDIHPFPLGVTSPTFANAEITSR
jgi:hypothetical protein